MRHLLLQTLWQGDPVSNPDLQKKVLRHESYKTHVQGLAKLRGTLVQAPSRAGVATAATGTSQACSGILASKHPLQQTITLFVQHGQPRMHYAKGETDPLEDIRFEVLSNDISIRHAKCKGVAGESMTACSECVQACKARTFKVAIAKQAYMIDLTMLTSHCYHSTAQELERFRAALPERDYQDARLALDLAALKNIAKKSLRTALDFQCFISVDTVPCELFADLHKWWTKEGKDLFRTSLTSRPKLRRSSNPRQWVPPKSKRRQRSCINYRTELRSSWTSRPWRGPRITRPRMRM